MMEDNSKAMSLPELLTSTSFQTFTNNHGTMMKNAYPNGAGNGFFFLFKDRTILETADHVCHPFDHEQGRTQRVFEDKVLFAILNMLFVREWMRKSIALTDMRLIKRLNVVYSKNPIQCLQII